MTTSPVKKSKVKKSAAKKKITKSRSIKKKATKKKTIKNSLVKPGSVKKRRVKKNQKLTARSSAKPGNKIALNSVLAINDAKMLYVELDNMLKVKKNISIDASAVEMVDSAILQVLLAFIKKAQLQSIGVTWVKPSKEFVSRSEILNLIDALGLKGA